MDNYNKKIIKLKNGIRLLVIPIKTKLTNISIKILLGQQHEKKNEMELSHYLEHIMASFTSNKYKDSKLIKKELNKKGAETNAYVNDYESNFYIEGLYDDIEYYIDLLSNMLNNFYIDKNIVDVEKKAVIQELNNYMADPEYIFDLKIWKYMFYKYSYQIDHKLHIDFIKNYNPDDLHDYFKKHILLKNILISVTCPIDKRERTIKLLKNAFNFKKNDQKYKIEYPIFHYKTSNIKIIYINNKNNNINNSNLKIIISKNILFNSPKHLSLIILNTILFNFQTGIFYEKLRRELGLIYNINLSIFIDKYNSKSSYYSINSSIIYTKIPDLITNIMKIFENIEITDEQIEYAKKKLEIDNEYNNFIGLNTYASYYGQYILFDKKIIERSKNIELFNKITNKDIQNELLNMRNDIFNKSLFFYYCKKNMNNKIKIDLKNNNISHKIKYINLN